MEKADRWDRTFDKDMVFLIPRKRYFETSSPYAGFKRFVEEKFTFLDGILGVYPLGTLQSIHLPCRGKELPAVGDGDADWGTRGQRTPRGKAPHSLHEGGLPASIHSVEEPTATGIELGHSGD